MPDAASPYAFLSYSRADQAFAARLARDLRGRNIHLWFDQLDIVPGQNWDAAIQHALHGARAVLFVVSATSVVSENVLNELTVALDSGKWLIPLVIARVPVPLRVTRLQRVDFTIDYALALNHLVAYLHGGGSRTTALEAIAASPPPYAGQAHPPTQRTFHPTQTVRPRPAWIAAAIAGVVVGVIGLLALLLVIGAASAGNKGTQSDGGVMPAPAPSPAAVVTPDGMQGNWVGACQSAKGGTTVRATLTFMATSYTLDQTYFGAPDCTAPLFAVNTVSDIVAMTPTVAGPFAADFRVRNVSLVPIASAVELNKSGLLGIRQWHDGVPFELPASAIAEHFGAPLGPGTLFYDLVALQGDTLREGLNRGTHVALSATERPLVLEDAVYTRLRPEQAPVPNQAQAQAP